MPDGGLLALLGLRRFGAEAAAARGVLMSVVLQPPPLVVAGARSARFERRLWADDRSRLLREAVLAARVLRARARPLFPLALVSDANTTQRRLRGADALHALWDHHLVVDDVAASNAAARRRHPHGILAADVKWLYKLASLLASPFAETVYLDPDVVLVSAELLESLLARSLRVADLVMPADPARAHNAHRRPTLGVQEAADPRPYSRGVPPLCSCLMAYRRTASVVALYERAALRMLVLCLLYTSPSPRDS